MPDFKVVSEYEPAGDQPQAIDKLAQGIENGLRAQVLKGVTGSGKTYTMAKVIERVNRPTLVLAHNKTLAAQLCEEFREFFPHNAVEYFVSYYDYYQPEAYIPHTDTYIEKDASTNEEIDRLRLSCHLRTAGAAGRDRGVLRQLHLRSGRAGRLRPHDDLPAHRHDHGAGRAAATAGGGSVRAQRRGLPAEHVPGAGRHGGAVPGLLQGQSHPGGVFRRRDRAHHGVPSRHRRSHEAAEPCGGVPRQPLRHAQGQVGAGGGGDRAGAGRAEEVVRGATASWWRRSASTSAPATTWR